MSKKDASSAVVVSSRGEKEGLCNIGVEKGKIDASKKLFLVLKGNTISTFPTPKDLDAIEKFDMTGCNLVMRDIKTKKKNGVPDITINLLNGKFLNLAVDTDDDMKDWCSHLYRSFIPVAFPNLVSFKPGGVCAEVFKPLPTFKSSPIIMHRSLLLKKLRLCSVVFRNENTSEYGEEKEMKRTTLVELVDACDSLKDLFAEIRASQDAVKMIALNLFRSLPIKNNEAGEDDEDDEPFMDPNWTHLSVVYEFLLHLVQSAHIDTNTKKKVLDTKFINQLLRLFDSEDIREREYLKTITHRIYGKLTNRRSTIRRAINNVFYEFVYETEKHSGIAELLEILASIINGFAVPIKPEHKLMLQRALIPLHKMKGLAAYHAQLAYCMTLFATKDPALAIDIVNGLLKFWPNGHSNKEILFLNELDDMFEHIDPVHFQIYRNALFRRIAKCVGCNHFQVAERALWLWNNAAVLGLIVENDQNRKIVFPMLFNGLMKNNLSHWHDSVKQLSQHVLALYSEADRPLFENLELNYNTSNNNY